VPPCNQNVMRVPRSHRGIVVCRDPVRDAILRGTVITLVEHRSASSLRRPDRKRAARAHRHRQRHDAAEETLNPFIILLALPLSAPVRAAVVLPDPRHPEPLVGPRHAGPLRRRGQQRDPADRPHPNLRRQGPPRGQAILEAKRDRLRPIFVTTLALVGGMLPLAIGTGPGAEERRAIAVVVIGGQTLSLFLTLVIVPVAYSLAADAASWLAGAAAERRPGRRAAENGPEFLILQRPHSNL
jgi:AcrB/AcrD/AcrF family protein